MSLKITTLVIVKKSEELQYGFSPTLSDLVFSPYLVFILDVNWFSLVLGAGLVLFWGQFSLDLGQDSPNLALF